MSADNFTGQFISSTFQRLLQLSDNGDYVTDGTGSVIDLISVTSSHALTASYVPGVTVTNPGGGLWSIQFNSASSFRGSDNLLFVSSSSTLLLTGSLVVTGSVRVTGSVFVDGGITGSLFGTASFADRAFRSTEIGDATNQLTVLQIGTSLGQSSNDSVYLADTAGSQLSSVTITDVGYAIQAGYAANAGNASYATTAGSTSAVGTLTQTVIVSGSVDLSGSLFLNGVEISTGGPESDPIFVAKSASLATTGSNIFKGNQIITGSVFITGSFGLTPFGTTPTNPPPQKGLFYFTDTDLYISVE